MREIEMTKECELGLIGPVKALAMLVIVLYHAWALYGCLGLANLSLRAVLSVSLCSGFPLCTYRSFF